MTYAFSEIACCAKGCQAVTVLHEDVEDKLRRTHELFYCPNGHAQHFPGKTREERRIEELEGQLRRLRYWTDEHARDMRDRIDEALTCPWPWCLRSGYHYGSQQTFIRHLHKYHGLPEQVDPREEAEAS